MSEINRDPEYRNFERPRSATGRLLVDLVEDELRGKEVLSTWKAELETDDVAVGFIRLKHGTYQDGMVHPLELDDNAGDSIADFMAGKDNHVFVDIEYKDVPKDHYGSRLNIKLRDDGKACGVLSKAGQAQDIFGLVHTEFETTGMASEPKLSAFALDNLKSLAMLGAKLDSSVPTYDEEIEIYELTDDILHEVHDTEEEADNAPESLRFEVASALIDYCEFSGDPKIGLTVRHESDDQLLQIDCDPLDGGYLMGDTRMSLTLGHPEGSSHNFVQLRQAYDGDLKYFIRRPALDETIIRTAQEADIAMFLKALMRIN